MERNLAARMILTDYVAEEFPYGLRFDYRDPRLEASLEKRGILSPLLWVSAGKKAALISGHKRFLYARRRHWEEIPATFIEETFSEKELFLLSLYSNWNQNFSELDRMEALRKGEKIFGLSPEEIREEVLPALGLGDHPGRLEEYRRLAGLDPTCHALIHQKKLPFRGVIDLDRFTQGEQRFLAASVFPFVHLTTNQLRLACEWLFDLQKIKKVSLGEIFREKSLREALDHSHLEPRARGERLFDALRQLRFPRLSQEEEDFLRLKNEFEPLREIQLERPEGFEEPGILLHARLKDREGLQRVLRFLAARQPSLETFL